MIHTELHPRWDDLPVETLNWDTATAFDFDVANESFEATIEGGEGPFLWIGPDGHSVGRSVTWGQTDGRVSIIPLMSFAGVERINVFGGGGVAFTTSDFTALPIDTVVSCVNDNHPRVTSMTLVVDTTLDGGPEGEISLPFRRGETYDIEVLTEAAADGSNENTIRYDEVAPQQTIAGVDLENFSPLVIGVEDTRVRVKIAGKMPRWTYANQPSTLSGQSVSRKDCLIAIEEWADLTWTNFNSSFYGAGWLLTTGAEMTYNTTSGEWEVAGTVDPEAYVPAPEGNVEFCFQGCTRYGDPDRVGTDCDIGDWDVSGVTNMNLIFRSATLFNQDLASWDVSNVTDFTSAFLGASNYNNGSQPLDASHPTESGWDMSSATVLDRVFQNTSFNQPVNDWTTDSVVSIEFAFSGTPFNQPVDGWNTANVTNMQKAFLRCSSFDQCVTDWDWTAVENAAFMFNQCDSFNNGGQPFDVNTSAALTNVAAMFRDAPSFNQPVSFEDTSQVRSFAYMFRGATSFNNGEAAGAGGTFYLDIGTGRSSADVSLFSMFTNTNAFNQAIGTWDTSNVISIYGFMRRNSVFNQDIGSWDVSNVTDFRFAFEGSGSFDNGGQPIIWDPAAGALMTSTFSNADMSTCDLSGINMSKVTDIGGMLFNTNFNGDVSTWDVSNITAFYGSRIPGGAGRGLFESSAFNQDVSSWQIDSLENGRSTFQNSGLSQANYEAILIGWEAYANTPAGVEFRGQDGMEYAAGSAAETARQNLIDNDNWAIDGDTAV